MVLCFRKSDVDVAGGDGVACLRVFPAVGLDLNPGAFLVDTSTPGTSQLEELLKLPTRIF